jgi:hypothetical protein
MFLQDRNLFLGARREDNKEDIEGLYGRVETGLIRISIGSGRGLL